MPAIVNNHMKRIRNQMNLTQAQLARLLDVHPSTLSKWESGAEVPDLFKRRFVEVANARLPVPVEPFQVFEVATAREVPA